MSLEVFSECLAFNRTHFIEILLGELWLKAQNRIDEQHCRGLHEIYIRTQFVLLFFSHLAVICTES